MSASSYQGPSPYVTEREARKRQSRARTWRRDAQMEMLAMMKAKDPARYDTVPPELKIALGHYLTDKAAAQAEGVDTTPPAA